DKLSAELKFYETRKESLEKPALPEGALTTALDADEVYKQHRQEKLIASKKVKRLVDAAARDDEFALKEARLQVKNAEQAMDRRRNELRQELETRLQSQAKTEYQSKVEQLKTQLKYVKDREEKAAARVESLAREAETLGKNSAKYELAKAAVEQERDANGKLSTRLNALQIEQNAEPRVRLYQEAAWQKKDSKKRIMLSILAPVVAFAGVAFAVGWWEFRARRIQSAEEV